MEELNMIYAALKSKYRMFQKNIYKKLLIPMSIFLTK